LEREGKPVRAESRIRAVIFDLFGTLVVSYRGEPFEGLIAGALGVTADDYRWALLETSDDRFRGRYPTVEAMMLGIGARLGIEPRPGAVARACAYRREATRASLVPRGGAVATLEALRRAGYQLGLISDCSPDVPPLWRTSELAMSIKCPVFSCEVGLRKPDVGIYRFACERLSVEPEECVYAGDGGSDELVGAGRVGMRPVLYEVPLGERERVWPVDWAGERITSLKGLFSLLPSSYGCPSGVGSENSA
jgi:putative hydrolase of the HAD superfamily